MKILAIDTATEACSAALYLDGEVSQHYRVAPREHSHIILPMIEQLLTDASIRLAELDALAFGRGPGSFMGVRIAAGVTQGIAFAWNLPVVPVSTLAAIAQTAHLQSGAAQVLSAIDARMNEVYWGAYRLSENGCMQLDGKEHVTAPEQVPVSEDRGWTGAGTGWSAYGDVLTAAVGAERLTAQLGDCLPSADSIARLAVVDYQAGRTVAAAQAVPVYLRDNVAKKSAA
ncbi:MAG: tRNA (adenosine(37)-N6)-threonylcarbamoyltransferase complex dimerization subunit type 1 TsaB [Thiotrichales bacterium]|nr:MAG: tRNA (adenosine(37)-N6)-threonylcarbamoyltransferase complex dimerization subunit type 1 TsaB [Thiotrichales bacterium]